jgi:hypothetical protein
VAEWTPFQTHYFSGNLIASGIEPETVVSTTPHNDIIVVVIIIIIIIT